MNYSGNGTAAQHHVRPIDHTCEEVVPQYGPEWLAHVAAGGEVRNGNILVHELQDPAPTGFRTSL